MSIHTKKVNDQALISQLATNYGFCPQKATLTPIGSGHINRTYLFSQPQKNLVVQQLNTQVFPKLDKMVNNARLLEQHLELKQQQQTYPLEVIRHIANRDGQYLSTLNGQTWRALSLVEGSYSVDIATTPEQAYRGANAFGLFASALGDFNAQQLYPVIADFHHLGKRFNALKQAAQADSLQRVTSVQAQLDFCYAQQHLVTELQQLSRDLELRTCHNDTKINNMLFCHNTHQAKAVIDLDTSMAGYWLFDFGDMVRTFCSPEPEDSTALDKVTIRHDMFAAISQGYLAPLAKEITTAETHSLWLGAQVMPLMVAVRFLTDYLNGDTYFAVDYPEHNYHRACNQLALYQAVLRDKNTLQPLLGLK